jgi:hypothetical protein
MTKIRLFIFTLLSLFLCSLAVPVHAQAGIQVISNEPNLSFPESITFPAEFKASANITSAVLEYGTDQLTCGTVVAKAFPTFTPAADVKVEWTWQMQQSGSLPPGASIWWQWQVQDANGAQFTSPRQTIIWLDSLHSWQEISGGNINLHYYNGGQAFGQALHDAAATALVRLSQDVGLSPEKPVDIYIYATTQDMTDAVLYEPQWSGGLVIPGYDIVIIGVSTDLLDWGKSTEAHELTHVLVGDLTFSCLGSIPTWLDEGLAVYGEGGPQPDQLALFDQAKAADQLPALRSLAGGFPEDANRAGLAYAESYSVINFLIQTDGRDKMNALLIALRDGATIDEALQSVYGFDTDGLENAWRLSIGAAPRPGSSNPTPAATPTQVPTIVPIGAAPLAPANPTPLPTRVQATATPVANTQVPGPTPTSVPLTERLGFSHDVVLGIEFGLGGCILAVLVIAVPVLVTTRRHSRRQK